MKWIRENIGYIPSFSAYERQVSLIEESVENNPDLCVEACKSLIEGICKTILTNKGVDYSKYDKFQVLVKVTIENMLTESDSYRDDLSEIARRISAVAQKISEIRDSAGFASHGQDVEHVSISYSLALLTSRITDVIGGFIMHFIVITQIEGQIGFYIRTINRLMIIMMSKTLLYRGHIHLGL